jgi:hypothetical protein
MHGETVKINIMFIFIQKYGRRNPSYTHYFTHILYIYFLKLILRLRWRN